MQPMLRDLQNEADIGLSIFIFVFMTRVTNMDADFNVHEESFS